MNTRYISNAFVSEALDCARRGGVDITALLDSVGIDAPGGGQISAPVFGRLWLGIAEATNDEFFGNAARPMRPGSFALMGHAVRDAPTVEIALRRALRFLKVAIDEPYGELHVSNGIAEIALHDSRKDRSAFAYRTYWVILHGLTCWLARARIPLHGLDITCPPPREQEDYHHFFGAPVRFGAEQGALRFDAVYLRRPVDRSEAALKRFLRAAPGNFLIGYKYDEGSLGAVMALLKARDPLDWPRFPDLAQELGMSAAKLRRQLAQQGHSYRSLKSDLRRDRAFLLLRDDRLSVSEVSHDLGFAEPSAFFRAFRGWTGHTPDEWRKGKRQDLS
ncbi:AraC family transcriptional regulator [Planktotalea sp.]|uniref:AraC family transcriptional regulator n=1 Tax=Planktotalea sp. TaxID=2029877 RepID=UPI003D6BB718